MSEPVFPRRVRRGLAVLCLSWAIGAHADPEADFRLGAQRYTAGDVIAAMALLKGAADAGHGAAQALYAEILDRADADEEAVAYYRRSAEQGNADGQFGYGSMLAAGEGIKADPGQGREWITRAALQGHRLAINELALAHLRGQLGISVESRNSAEALGWIRQAAGNDFIPAMEALADAYRTGGFGLAPDAALAEEWTQRVRKARGLLGKRKGGKR
jgi:TPR repeat protein